MTDSDLELPLLTEVADTSPDDLPILFEIIVDPDEDPQPDLVQDKPAPPRALNAEEMSHLLGQLETHLETVFAGKLNSRLEELQRLAVDLAVSEFKAELPKLLREALSKPDESNK
jgi:hypothetical protein